ncbi:hypothetical protein D9M68_613440 [compost metagenome]
MPCELLNFGHPILGGCRFIGLPLGLVSRKVGGHCRKDGDHKQARRDEGKATSNRRSPFLCLGGPGLLLRNPFGIANTALLLFPLCRFANALRRDAGTEVVAFDGGLGHRKVSIGRQRLGILQASVAMHHQVVAAAALLPLLGGTLQAFEQAQLVPVLHQPVAELGPSAQQCLVRDLAGFTPL